MKVLRQAGKASCSPILFRTSATAVCEQNDAPVDREVPMADAESAQGETITMTDASTTVSDDGLCTWPEVLIAANTDTVPGSTDDECAAGGANEAGIMVFADGVGDINLI